MLSGTSFTVAVWAGFRQGRPEATVQGGCTSSRERKNARDLGGAVIRCALGAAMVGLLAKARPAKACTACARQLPCLAQCWLGQGGKLVVVDAEVLFGKGDFSLNAHR